LDFFYPTPILTVHFNYFLHRTPKLRFPTRNCWNGTISSETFIETENSCCAPRFLLVAVCYKIVDSQIWFTLCEVVGVGFGVGHFGQVGKFCKLWVGHFTSDSSTLATTTEIKHVEYLSASFNSNLTSNSSTIINRWNCKSENTCTIHFNCPVKDIFKLLPGLWSRR